MLRTADRPRLAVATVVLVTVVANCRQLTWPFVDDDWALIWRDTFPGGFREFTDPLPSVLYRPVSWGGISLLHSLFGEHPFPYHVVSLAFVVGSALLIRQLALRLGLAPGAALVAAAVFGAHPMFAWATAWVSAMGTVTGQFFAIGALCLVVTERPSWRAQAGSVLLLALAIGSHETFAVTPVVAVLLRFGAHRTVRGALTGTLPVWVTGVGLLLWEKVNSIQLPADNPYIARFRPDKMWHNLLRLLEMLTGLPLVRPDRLGTASSVALAVVIWVVLLALAALAVQKGNWLPLAGLVATVPAMGPVTLLVQHAMDPYYVEVAAIPFAIAVAACVPLERVAYAVAGVCGLAGLLIMAPELSHSALGASRVRERRVIATVRAAYPLPAPKKVTLSIGTPGANDARLVSVILREPHVQVVFR